MEKIIRKEAGKNVYNFISLHVDIDNPKTFVVSTTIVFNIEKQEDKYDTIINLKRINDIIRINKFFEAINSKLPVNGIFVCCAETCKSRRRRIIRKFPSFFSYPYYIIDFIFKRIFPKIWGFRKFYFLITQGRNRVISKAEFLGRLVSCGFKIIDFKRYNNQLYCVCKKIKKPAYDLHPSYGLIYKMDRVGKKEKIIGVYKFRTMHPYAEYLQDYVIEISGYSQKGKPAEDFRLTGWGKFLRRYWLDELPQLINVIKGEMRLVGVRPLSKRFLKEYPQDILQMRFKHKPGCIPPYVALLKQDVEEYIESEKIYLTEREKHPFITDIKYFFKSIYNILTNKIRSA
jgi:lipopolysaccharide/colanic/teichoic acid biosynthesis glycosyltransferase